MNGSRRLLVIEDEVNDLKNAAEAARLTGFPEVEARSTPHAAKVYIEELLAGGSALPDAILLDLDFGYESGYEFLRYWHSTPKLRSVPMIVWSILGEEQKEMCGLFNVSRFVGKWEGSEALQSALKEIRQ